MILDSSAIVAVLAKEPERDQFIAMIASSERAAIAAPTLLETMIALSSFGPALLDDLKKLVAEAPLEILPFGSEQLVAAQNAFMRYGRATGHRARLNFGDCISYATAVVAHEPLLFKGNDFIHTDVMVAQQSSSSLVYGTADDRGSRKRRIVATAAARTKRPPRA